MYNMHNQSFLVEKIFFFFAPRSLFYDDAIRLQFGIGEVWNLMLSHLSFHNAYLPNL